MIYGRSAVVDAKYLFSGYVCIGSKKLYNVLEMQT